VVELLPQNNARVKIERPRACQHCGMCFLREEGEIFLIVENSVGADVGEKVKLGLEEGMVIKGAALLFLLPIAVGFLGYGVGALIRRATGVGVEWGGAVLFFACSFLFIRWYDRHYGHLMKFRIVGKGEEDSFQQIPQA